VRLGFREREGRSGEERYGGEPVRRRSDYCVDLVHPLEGVQQAVHDRLSCVEAVPLLVFVPAQHGRPLIRGKPPGCVRFPGREATKLCLESCLPPRPLLHPPNAAEQTCALCGHNEPAKVDRQQPGVDWGDFAVCYPVRQIQQKRCRRRPWGWHEHHHAVCSAPSPCARLSRGATRDRLPFSPIRLSTTPDDDDGSLDSLEAGTNGTVAPSSEARGSLSPTRKSGSCAAASRPIASAVLQVAPHQ
jgi:hypothetical protein